MGLYKIKIDGRNLRLSGFYDKAGNVKRFPDYGAYKSLPAGRVRNLYAPLSFTAYSTDWMIWAFNNKYQPHTETNEKGYLMGYIDASKANSVKVIGSMKTIWKEFEAFAARGERPLEDMTIEEVEEEWWSYYCSKYYDKYLYGVKVLQDYIKGRRLQFTEEEREREASYTPYFDNDDFWQYCCSDYLKYLIRVSARGFMLERLLFEALCERSGGELIESSVQDERKGIDGWLVLEGVRYPICLKPSTFRGGVSPVDNRCFVVYGKNNGDLVYTFKTGEELLKKCE